MKLVTTLVCALALVLALAGCGASSAPTAADQERWAEGIPGVPGEPGLPGNPGNPAAPAPEAARVVEMADAPAPQAMAAPAAPAAPPAVPAAAAPAASAMMVDDTTRSVGAAAEFADAPVAEFSEAQAALVAQQRIIVRTVNMGIVVGNVSDAIAEIGRAAAAQGGWVVGTDRSSTHSGFIAVRVPARMLDDFVDTRIGAIALEVDSHNSTSTDVTDEYYDLNARVDSLKATEGALIRLLDRAEDVEDALEVQRELAALQAEIEAHLGRIKLLEETSAFSLINISLTVAPLDMRVSAGTDRTLSVGEFARFRAKFYQPEGIDEFTTTWDFGDGKPPVTIYNSVASADPGQRTTATVNHTYDDDRDSPYIVQVKIVGTGKAGLAEGSDTFIVTVTRIPVIEVFLDGDVVYEGGGVEEGEEVEYSGAFTRPDGLRDLRYEWDFGDGSRAITGVPVEGETRVSAKHTYANSRPIPYTVTLTITAESDAGRVHSASSFDVYVSESRGLVVGGWSAGDTAKTAVRALSVVGQALGSALIWLAIFSPAWLIVGGVVFLAVRLNNRRRQQQNALRLGLRRQSQGGGDAAADGEAQA